MNQSSGEKGRLTWLFLSPLKTWADMDLRSRLDTLLNIDQGLKLRPTPHGEYVLFGSVWTLNLLKYDCLWTYSI